MTSYYVTSLRMAVRVRSWWHVERAGRMTSWRWARCCHVTSRRPSSCPAARLQSQCSC